MMLICPNDQAPIPSPLGRVLMVQHALRILTKTREALNNGRDQKKENRHLSVRHSFELNKQTQLLILNVF
jgi:hypothetical protein